MKRDMRLWRVLVEDTERNSADVIVSATTALAASRRALKEVNSYGRSDWAESGPWHVVKKDQAVVEIALAPARIHAVVPGWE